MIKSKLPYFIFWVTFLFLIHNVHSQNVLKGVVVDASEGFPLPYARISVNCLNDVVFADQTGNYYIKLKQDSCEIEFYSTAYQAIKRTIVFTPKKREIKLDIKLSPEAQLLDAANVVSTKYVNDPIQSTSSLAVIDPKKAESKNITSVDALLNTAGGIAVVDNEPQIRGGSGFSSGMGSRVMILLDDMPLLRPDAGRPMWNFIPMEGVEQVDVLKGAAS
ncbi:MAG: TonB-dependent receptor plug domain-containing protein, partial [Bacteroidales bacterium]